MIFRELELFHSTGCPAGGQMNLNLCKVWTTSYWNLWISWLYTVLCSALSRNINTDVHCECAHRGTAYLRKPEMQTDSSEFLMSPSINRLSESNRVICSVSEETYCRWQSLICTPFPLHQRKEVIAPCQGGGEIREYELPESGTHKGPFQPQGLPLSNIMICGKIINQYLPFSSRNAIVNFISLPALTYFHQVFIHLEMVK